MTHMRGLWARPIAALVAVILTGAGVFACLPNAYAAAKGTILILNNVTPGTSSTAVSGVFADEDSNPLDSFDLTVSVNGKTVGTTATDASGHFTFSFPNPAQGDHTVIVMWSGDAQYQRSSDSRIFHISPAAKPKTTLTATADPATAYPGATITVSGALTSETGEGITLARITVTLVWGELSQMTITGEGGKYDIVFAVPSKAEFPSSVDLLVEYRGDNVYASTSVIAKLGLQSTPTPTPTPSGSSTNTSTPTPVATTSAAPTTAPTGTPSSGSQTLQGNPNLTLGLIITAGVAVAAVLTLLILAIVSNNRHRLADDERRGFGSDFGVKNR